MYRTYLSEKYDVSYLTPCTIRISHYSLWSFYWPYIGIITAYFIVNIVPYLRNGKGSLPSEIGLGGNVGQKRVMLQRERVIEKHVK